MLKIYLLLIIIQHCSSECEYEKYVYQDNKCIILKNFNTFDQLNFTCPRFYNISMLQIQPEQRVVLNNSLNLTNFYVQPVEQLFSVSLKNIRGFELSSNPFNKTGFKSINYQNLFWIFYDSNIDFYYKNILVNSICNEELFNDRSWNNYVFYGKIVSLEKSSIFSPNICPIAFRNVKVASLIIHYISSSFISKNLLSFQIIPQNISNKINANIFQVDFRIYRSEVNKDLLNSILFNRTRIFDLSGEIQSIQFDVFRSFKRIKLLRLRMQNVRNVLTKNNKWMQYLNDHLKKINMDDIDEINTNLKDSLILIIYQAFPSVTFYDYPEEDFCYYKNFPHDKLVLPMLKPNYKTTCSCAELYLIKYSYKFSDAIYFYKDSITSFYNLGQYYSDFIIQNKFSHCVNFTFRYTLSKCDFENRLNRCQLETVKNDNNSQLFIYIEDIRLLSSYSKYFISVFINTTFSFIVIVINILIIIILSTNVIPNDYKKMYSYIILNFFFNSAFILMNSFKLINTCIKDDLFCSKFYESIQAQYFNLIFCKLIANTFQSVSNIAHLSFTLSRYLTITDSKFFLLNKIDNMPRKLYAFLTIVFSFLLNFFIYFEYSVRKDTPESYQLQPFEIRNFSSYYKNDLTDDFKENFTEYEYLLLNFFQYIKIIFSDSFYMIVSFLIDIFLLRFVKKKLKLKKKLVFVQPMFIKYVNPTFGIMLNPNKKQQRKRDKINSTKKRFTSMIILNGINFLIFRLPLAVINFYGFLFRYDKKLHKYKPNLISYILCRPYKLCLTLEDFLYFIYLNSFFVQLFILYKLDKNFVESFKYLKRKFLNVKKKNSMTE